MGKRLVAAAAVGGAVVAAAVVSWAPWNRVGPLSVHESQNVLESVRRVTRLATVEVSVSNWQMRRDEKPLFGFVPIKCQKTVAVFYRGKVGAGFDLTGERAMGLTVQADPSRRMVHVRLPTPMILYTDVPAPSVLVADGSLCNRFSPDDATSLQAEARRAIQQEAIEGGVLARAETHARELLEGVLRPLGYDLVLEVGGAPAVAGAEPPR